MIVLCRLELQSCSPRLQHCLTASQGIWAFNPEISGRNLCGRRKREKAYFWNILEIFPSRTLACLVDIELRDDVTLPSPSVRLPKQDLSLAEMWQLIPMWKCQIVRSGPATLHIFSCLLIIIMGPTNHQPHAQLGLYYLFFLFFWNVFYDVFSMDLSVLRCGI